jgi:hypothetical protein
MINLHEHFIFQVLVLSAVALIIWQMKIGDTIDLMRHPTKGWWFWMRRVTMVSKAVTLCWAVTYAYQNDWAPWPPFMAFMIAFDIYIGSNIAIMYDDITKIREAQRRGALSRSPAL